MNIAMEQTEEYVNGQLKNKYGDCFIRGNNGENGIQRAGLRWSTWFSLPPRASAAEDLHVLLSPPIAVLLSFSLTVRHHPGLAASCQSAVSLWAKPTHACHPFPLQCFTSVRCGKADEHN